MEIIKYNDTFNNDVKDLLCELQNHIIALDDFKLQTMTNAYRELYFNEMLEKTKEGGCIFIAIEDQIVLGFIAAGIEKTNAVDSTTLKLDKIGKIYELCVTNKMRGKNIGSQLVERAEKELKKKGCEFIYIDVFANNKSALAFYQKQGYNNRNIELIKKIRK